MEGVEFLRGAIEGLTAEEFGRLILSLDSMREMVIEDLEDGLGDMGMFDDVESVDEAKDVLRRLMR